MPGEDTLVAEAEADHSEEATDPAGPEQGGEGDGRAGGGPSRRARLGLLALGLLGRAASAALADPPAPERRREPATDGVVDGSEAEAAPDETGTGAGNGEGSERGAAGAAATGPGFERDLGTVTPAGTTVLVPPVLAGRPARARREPDVGTGTESPPEEERPGIVGRAWARVAASRWWRWGRWLPVVVLGAAAAAVLGLLWLFATVDLPGESPEASSTVVLDAKGRELALLSDDQLQLPVKLDQMSPEVAASLVAAEDRSFYDHLGIDPVGIGRALHRNLTTQDVEGASTITQQLVKNEFLGSERSWRRKIEEAVLAVKLERRSDKSEILERYLNSVYFGRGARGIESAARVYFDRAARDLTTAQAAYLIGLLPAPSRADPMAQPVTAARRRNRVVDARVATGSLTPVQGAAARAEPLLALPGTRPVTLTAGVAPHFVEWVRDLLIDRYGEAGVYGTGLRVRTTLDLDDQRAAEQAVAAALDDPADPQAALVAVDRTGAVRAYAGARPGTGSQVDFARGVGGGGRGRQAGSTFKPFALAAALERGVPLDRPLAGPGEITLSPPSGPWTVHNYGGQGFGTVSLLDATVSSVNTVYAQLGLETGPAAVADVARRAGIRSTLGANPSIVLGVDDVAPVEMAGAYLTFARDGRSVEPFAIAEVRDRRGELALTADDTSRDALDPGVARSVNAALQQAVARGTGTAARLDRPVAGKTGTTESNGDAWFAGYTPEYTAVVWMGYPEGAQRRMTNVRGRAITGGSIPAEIWKAFAGPALADVPPTPFAPPPPERTGAPPAPPALTVQSDVVAPGEPVRVAGTGLGACTADFQVQVLPEAAAPGTQPTLRSASEAGSSQPSRRADIALPASMSPGRWRVVAVCDDGRGARPVAEARFTVAEPRPVAAVSSVAS